MITDEKSGDFRFLENRKWEFDLSYELFGERFGIRSDVAFPLEWLLKLLPPNAVIVEAGKTGNTFYFLTDPESEHRGVYWNREFLNGFYDYDSDTIEVLECKLQYAMALALLPEWTFLHAGAVAFEGSGIIMPGRSKAGKTSLTTAFVEAGAEYYTDDCAVIDAVGNLHPYPTPMRVRKNGTEDRILVRPEDLGSRCGREPVPIRALVFTHYEKGGRWSPSGAGGGRAVWRMIQDLFYVPAMRESPREILRGLAAVSERALILEGARGEASEVVEDVFRRLGEKRA